MNEDKSTRYHRLRRRAQVASLMAAGAGLVLVSFWAGPALADAAEAFADAVGSRGAWHRALVVVAAAAMLVGGLELLALPSAWYLGLELQRRYGLSRQTPREWWRDHVKAVLLGLSVSVAAALIVYRTMAWSPAAWWAVAGVLLAGLGALVALGAPVVLLPLFYRFTPLPDGEISSRLQALTARAGVPVLGIYQWSLGDRTRAANAALVGLGPTRRVLVSDTLLGQYSPDEIEVIVAHELGHHVHGDLWVGLGTEAAQGVVALLVAHLVLGTLGVSLVPLMRLDDVAGMPLLALSVGVWTAVTAPVLLALSRQHERRADRYALDLTGQSAAFVSAMRRLGSQNLAEGTPSRVVRWLFSSHPSIDERIAAAQRWSSDRETTAA